jgi:hypothetical protein
VSDHSVPPNCAGSRPASGGQARLTDALAAGREPIGDPPPDEDDNE